MVQLDLSPRPDRAAPGGTPMGSARTLRFALAAVALALAATAAAQDRPADSAVLLAPAPPPTLAGAPAPGPLVVTHGGVGSGPEYGDGARAAADTALRVLRRGGSALDAALAGTVWLEDDPRFNAGTGANIRLDGRTIQMDAAVMCGDGRFAAVGAIERVRNPVRVARAVMDSTPHLFLVGEGATRFAHRIGFADVVPTSAPAEAKYRARMRRQAELLGRRDTTVFDWRRFWNFAGAMPADVLEWGRHGDTVGSVARSADGRFAATLSTGGTSVTLCGRVGDVPVFGCGLYAGPAGAVACTGEGEQIIRRTLARAVYERLERGASARQAVEEAVRMFPERWDVGLIAVDRAGWGVAANRPMAYGVGN
jgi:isoaspartyl peptidase/L-asparaginase-like protein (Ntn-hydrolase superfamily)